MSCMLMLWLAIFVNLVYCPPAVTPPIQDLSPADHDTLVNYCALMHAAYDYGQLFALRKKKLSTEEVAAFNARWEHVFEVPLFQTGITQTEFVLGSRFSEGNLDAFPPSSRYADGNPDTYLLFHLAKEIGMVQSAGFSTCPSCVDQSIAKAGAYLEATPLYVRLSEVWPYLAEIPRIRTAHEVDTLWALLSCTFANAMASPGSADALDLAMPQIHCDDTITVRAFKEISPAFYVVWHTCDANGAMTTGAPELISGRPRKQGSVYRIRIVAETACSSVHRDQYYIIE